MFSSHDGNLRSGPGKNESWVICLATHRIITGSKTVAHEDRKFRHRTVCHCIYHLCPVFYNSSLFRPLADHKPCHVLEEDQRDAFLIAVKNEAGRLICAVTVDDPAYLHFSLFCLDHRTLVCDNADCPSIDT